MNSESKLEKFGAYQKANALFDLVVSDLQTLRSNPLCGRLISQQIASADSIASNIEEGYGRGSRKEYVQFLIIARGSAHETRGRYRRLGHWLSSPIIEQRVQLCTEIILILTATVKRLRANP